MLLLLLILRIEEIQCGSSTQVPLYLVGFTRSGKGARKFFIKEKVLVTFKAKEEGFSFFYTHNQDFP